MRLLRLALFLLLTVNTVYFVLSGSTNKAIDSCAWLMLLALFMIETSFRERPTRANWISTLRALRLLAAAGVFAATAGYVFEDNRLDAANSVLWILVVALLEVQLRFSALDKRHRRTFVFCAALLYGGLGVLVIIWAARGMWFDAFDALLWLAAFVAIELAVTQPRPAPHG